MLYAFMRRHLAVAVAAAVLVQPVFAQTYPNRPVRLVVPFSPGGAADVPGRILTQKMSEALGHQVVVDNRPGAGSTIGADLVAKAPPDGYTLLTISNTHFVSAALYRKLNYDPLNDYTPITQVTSAPNVLIVHPSLPAQSLAEFIALAKRKPGALSYGTPGIGTSPHLSMELLKSMAGIDLQHVPYRGTAAAVTDLIGGQIAATFANALTAKPQVDAGRVRALAITGPKRIEALPNVPPVAEAGVPGYEAMQWYGLLAPAGTPPPIVARLNAEALKALQSDEMKEKLAADGAQPVGTSAEEFAALIRSELDKWTRVARAADIAPQ